MKQYRDQWLSILFIGILFAGMMGNILMPDLEVLKTERRKAAAFPELTWPGIASGKVMEGMEEYLRDQMIFREPLRAMKADTYRNVFFTKEYNGLYRIGDTICSLDYPLREDRVIRAADQFSAIAEAYFPDADVYYAVIPDKNYFTSKKAGYPSMDYEQLYSVMEGKMTGVSYIDITNLLSIDDYYRTDLHWKQEEITDVADLLLEEMGKESGGMYTEFAEYKEYKGAYAAQSGWNVPPDTIKCLTNPEIERAVVYDYETKKEIPVYRTEFFSETSESMDAYDVYLSGAKPLLTLTNPENAGKEELILFRDSFGSSIAPLLLKGYSKITIIDLRYVKMEYVADLLELPEKCDVLFLYNTIVINHMF